MALLKDQKLINQLEYTPQGYRLKNADGSYTYYENSLSGYVPVRYLPPQGSISQQEAANAAAASNPYVSATTNANFNPSPQGYQNTGVYTGQIVPQTSLPPIDQIAKPSGLTKYDPTGQKVDSTTGRPVAIDEGRGQYYYTDTPNKWWDQVSTAVPTGPMPASQAGPQTSLNIKDTTSAPSDAAAIKAASEQYIKDLQSRYTSSAPTPEATQASAISKRMMEEIQALSGKAADLGAREAAIDPMRQSYQDLASQMLAKNAEYKAIQSQYDNLATSNLDKPITMGSIIGANAQVERQKIMALNSKASEIGMLSAQALAMQGQIAQAEEAAVRANNLKFAGRLEQIEIAKAQLAILAPILEGQEKKAAAELKRQYDLQEAQVKIAQANEKDKNSTVLNLMQTYNDAGISLNDTIESANAKITNNSKIYREKVRPPANAGGGAGGSKLLSPSEAAALGVPFGTTEAQAFGKTPQKPATAAQETVAGYAVRLEQSIPTINSLEPKIAKMNPIEFEAQSRMPSYLQGAEMQQYMQAARNFINANLRRESGAVISTTEFDNAYQQYLPRPKDSAKTLQQKKANRDLVFASLKQAAGPAFSSVEELIGTTKSASDPAGLLQGVTSKNPLGI